MNHLKKSLAVALLLLLIGLPGISAIAVGAWAPSTALAVAGSILLIAILIIPYLLAKAVHAIGQDRERLTRYFRALFRLATYLLAAILLFEAVLLGLTAVLVASSPDPMGLPLIWLALWSLGLLVATYTLLRESHRLLAPQPVTVTAVSVQESEAPELWTRVRRLAATLGAPPPERILIGLEPRAFVTTGPVTLGSGTDALSGETLYLSALLLRVLPDDELDAVIGHELGHFRGQDLSYSQRFIPAFRSLQHALSTVDAEEPRHSMNPLRGWIVLARLPAALLLRWLAALVALAKLRIDRERELAADTAATEVAPARSLMLAIVKIQLLQSLWSVCLQTIVKAIRDGKPRINLVSFYRESAKRFWTPEQRITALQLRISSTGVAHPTDTHPPLGERAAALDTNLDGIVAQSVAAFVEPPPSAPWVAALEQKISHLHYELASNRSWVKDFIVERNSSEQRTFGEA